MSFPPTRLSVVERTRSDDAETRRLAFASMIEAYWKPVYKYLRLKWQLDPDAAADLTQEFFAATLEKDVLGRFDPARARFRTYLRLCVDGFASNVRKAEGRLKRGGGCLDRAARLSISGRRDWPSRAGGAGGRRRAVLSGVGPHAVSACRGRSARVGRTPQAGRRCSRCSAAMISKRDGRSANVCGDRPRAGLHGHDGHQSPCGMRRQFRRFVLTRLRDLTTTEDEYEAEARRLLGSAAVTRGSATRPSLISAMSPNGRILASATRSCDVSGAAEWVWSTPRAT